MCTWVKLGVIETSTSMWYRDSAGMLQNHNCVTQYPPVKGMVKNVFFWDHNHTEGGKDENSSKQNSTEAAMAARLALYLTQQGYQAGDITILTPYVGQLMLLRAEVRKYMRFVVSDKDAEQLDMLQVTRAVQPSPASDTSCLRSIEFLCSTDPHTCQSFRQ